MDQHEFNARTAAYVEQICNSMILSVREPWRRIEMEGTFYRTHMKYVCTYIVASNGEQKTFRPGLAAQQSYLDLRSTFRAMGKGTWSRARCTLTDRERTMNYFYEGDADGFFPTPIPTEKDHEPNPNPDQGGDPSAPEALN